MADRPTREALTTPEEQHRKVTAQTTVRDVETLTALAAVVDLPWPKRVSLTEQRVYLHWEADDPAAHPVERWSNVLGFTPVETAPFVEVDVTGSTLLTRVHAGGDFGDHGTYVALTQYRVES